MSASCPAAECGFSGPVEAVCGHIGGSSDSLHEGVATDQFGKQGASKGLSTPFMIALAGAVLIGGYFVLEGVEVTESGSGETALEGDQQETTEGSPSEGASEGENEEVQLLE